MSFTHTVCVTVSLKLEEKSRASSTPSIPGVGVSGCWWGHCCGVYLPLWFDLGAWARQVLARLMCIKSPSSSGVKLMCGKYVWVWGWKDWMSCRGCSRSPESLPCQSRIFVLAFHPPRLEGNLDFFNAQACLSPKAYSSRCLGLTRCHVCLDSRSLFSAAFGHTSLSCYLDDSTVNSLLQEDFSGEKRELKNIWWILCLLLRMYLPMKIESMEI